MHVVVPKPLHTFGRHALELAASGGALTFGHNLDTRSEHRLPGAAWTFVRPALCIARSLCYQRAGFGRKVRMLQVINSALSDIRDSLRLRRVWMAFAKEDITDQHRRTALGPFWLLINYLGFAGTFVVVFGQSHATVNYPGYIAI